MVGPAGRMVVIASSLGGVSALSRLLGALPASFPVPIGIVQHQAPLASARLLTGVLAACTSLHVRLAVQDATLRAGAVYVAPPNGHFTLADDGRVAIVRGRNQRGLSSAADPLFESSAKLFGPELLAVVLTGTDGDGSSGAVVVRDAGGRVIVQDPHEAHAPGMPESALAKAGADWVVALDEIAPLLERLVANRDAAG